MRYILSNDKDMFSIYDEDIQRGRAISVKTGEAWDITDKGILSEIKERGEAVWGRKASFEKSLMSVNVTTFISTKFRRKLTFH